MAFTAITACFVILFIGGAWDQALASVSAYLGTKQVMEGAPDDHVRTLKDMGFDTILLKTNFPLDALGSRRLEEYLDASEGEGLAVSIVVNLMDQQLFTNNSPQTPDEYRLQLCSISNDIWSQVGKRIDTLLKIIDTHKGVRALVFDTEWYVNFNASLCSSQVQQHEQQAQEHFSTLLDNVRKKQQQLTLGILGYEENWFSRGILEATLKIDSKPNVYLEQSYSSGLSPEFLRFKTSIALRYPGINVIPGLWLQQLTPAQLKTEVTASLHHFDSVWIFSAMSLLAPPDNLTGPYALFFNQRDYKAVIRDTSRKLKSPQSFTPTLPTETHKEGTPPEISSTILKAHQVAIERLNLQELRFPDIEASNQLSSLRGTNLLLFFQDNHSPAEFIVSAETKRIGAYRDQTHLLDSAGRFLGRAQLGSVLRLSIPFAQNGAIPITIAAGRNRADIDLSHAKIAAIASKDAPLSLVNPQQRFSVFVNSTVASFVMRYEVDAPQEDATVAESSGSWDVRLEKGNRGERRAIFTRIAYKNPQNPVFCFKRSAMGVGFEDVKNIILERITPLLIPLDKRHPFGCL